MNEPIQCREEENELDWFAKRWQSTWNAREERPALSLICRSTEVEI
jgi:hypothetical protein